MEGPAESIAPVDWTPTLFPGMPQRGGPSGEDESAEKAVYGAVVDAVSVGSFTRE
jgi:hypothetical protein